MTLVSTIAIAHSHHCPTLTTSSILLKHKCPAYFGEQACKIFFMRIESRRTLRYAQCPSHIQEFCIQTMDGLASLGHFVDYPSPLADMYVHIYMGGEMV